MAAVDRLLDAVHRIGERLVEAAGQTTADAWAALFTGPVVVVGAIQAGLFLWQLRLIRRSLSDTKQSADAATEAAKAATRQAETSVEAVRAATRQAVAAEENLKKLERPYIFVFDLSDFLKDDDNGEYYVTCTVANFGKIPAMIHMAHLGFEPSRPAEPGFPTLVDEGHTLLRAPILAPGEKRLIRTYAPLGLVVGDNGVNVITEEHSGETHVRPIPLLDMTDGFVLYFRAVIKYEGPFTRSHESGALWVNISPGKFVARHEEHNYTR